MRIAVCDDAASDRAQMMALLTRYMEEREMADADIQAFADGEALLDAVARDGAFDVVLLDMLMPEKNGIATAQALRQAGDEALIIYLSCSRDYAVESYEVQAFHYLLKPVAEEKFFEVMDGALASCHRRQREVVIVPTREGRQRLFLADILYVERKERNMCYVCPHGKVMSTTLRMSFREAVAPLLDDERFCLAGASFLVNLAHVSSVKGQTVIFDNGFTLNIPRLAVSALKDAWGNYWLGGEVE